MTQNLLSIGPLIYYDLSPSDIATIHYSIDELMSCGYDPVDPRLYDKAWQFLPRVPEEIREFFDNFRRREPAAACLLRGLPVDNVEIGPTPADWMSAAASPVGMREEFFLALMAMCLGEIFSWSTLQDGRLISNILPVRGEENEQSGHGSNSLLEWHTEDAFHPFRCDYLMLLGMRNNDRVPTTLASIRDVTLKEKSIHILSQPRFYILPDDEHLRQFGVRYPDHPSLHRMQQMRESPRLVPVLFGDLISPYLCIDPYFMHCREGDADAGIALQELTNELARIQQDVVVEPGHLLVIDNYVSVHGRRAFEARYDGTDRWLKKAIVARDMRKSRAALPIPGHRILL